MAKPQKENGYLAIANEIVDRFCNYRLSGEEWLVLWVILRKTYGYNKKEDYISLSQFASITTLKRPTVVRTIKKLVKKNIITVSKKATSGVNLYRFNKDFDKWRVVAKKLPVVAKKLIGGSKNDNRVVAKKLHTKDNIQKTILQKTIIADKSADELNQIFTLFYKSINPTINFGNKTQRKAIEEMIKKLGFEKLKKTVEYAISIQGKQYAPTITTPLQLKNKLGDLLVYWKKNNTSRTVKV